MIFKLLKCALGEVEKREELKLSADAWQAIYDLSKKHDLAHLIGYALNFYDVEIDPELRASFDKAINIAGFRYAKSSYELEALSETLEKAEICFVPLKGSVINRYYSEPWLRTSCDIDILVKKEDLERATDALVTTLGYKRQFATTHDVSIMTPSGVHIELHFDLQEEGFNSSDTLANVWCSGELEKVANFEHKMTNELFLFYHVYHMAKHFKLGGCGIKPLLDLIIIRNKMGYDENKVLALLENEGYGVFYKNALALAEAWFEDGAHTELSKEMQDYILDGGVYGSMQHNLAIAQSKEGRFARLWKRIFMPYKQLIIRYPSLKKCPPLYPFYLVRRWLRIIFSRDRKRAFDEIKLNQQVTSAQIEYSKRLMGNLGL